MKNPAKRALLAEEKSSLGILAEDKVVIEEGKIVTKDDQDGKYDF